MAPFRDPRSPLESPRDPLDRFSELYGALDDGRSWLTRSYYAPWLHSAIALMTVPGEPVALAAAVHECDAQLRKRRDLFEFHHEEARTVVAAQLVARGDSAAAFIDEVRRAHGLFRRARLREGGIYEVLGTLVLRRVLHGQPIQPEHATRFKAIYEQLKRHHWLLTGPDDFAACAMLVGQPDTPQIIGEGVAAIYQALRQVADLRRGDALQTTANLLYLTRMEPDRIARRFSEVAAGLRAAGYRVRTHDYDEVALLCFVAAPVEKTVAAALELLARIRSVMPNLNGDMGLSLTTLVIGHDVRLGTLVDAKMLLDILMIMNRWQIGATVGASL